jgi:hypothetical protein
MFVKELKSDYDPLSKDIWPLALGLATRETKQAQREKTSDQSQFR